MADDTYTHQYDGNVAVVTKQKTNMKKLLILGIGLLTVLPSHAQTFGPNALGTAVVGGVLGGVIGHNSGHRTAEGAAIGAVSGLVLGAIADNSFRQPAVCYPTPVVVRPVPVVSYPYHHHHYYPRPAFIPAVVSTPMATCATVPVQPVTMVPAPAQTVIINNYYGTRR